MAQMAHPIGFNLRAGTMTTSISNTTITINTTMIMITMVTIGANKALRSANLE